MTGQKKCIKIMIYDENKIYHMEVQMSKTNNEKGRYLTACLKLCVKKRQNF